jgi:signal transduction histidine kinase
MTSAKHAPAGAITLDGGLWGALRVVSKSEEPLPRDTEQRLAEFADLFATAIASSDAHQELREAHRELSEAHQELARLAEEQAALRRVATLAAQGVAPTRVFGKVAAEVGGLIPADAAGLGRYESDGVTAVASWSKAGGCRPGGARRTLHKGAVAQLVFETRRPGRIDDYEGLPGTAAATVRDWGWRSAVGAPVIVEGGLWGLILVASTSDQPLPPDTEERLAKFTELLATAIANAEGRAELDASRARIVATADATRRRIERDLHDGAQQQLVSLALVLRAAQATLPKELGEHHSELDRVVDGLTVALDDLREIALGIHPAGLTEDGLTPALKRLVSRSALRVNLHTRAANRFPEPVEVTAYYVVSEALTNAAKYADTPHVDVAVEADESELRVKVHDNGRGGADPNHGSGLLGLRDRVEAIGGTMHLTSPPGTGTTLNVALPLHDPTAHR